MGAHKGLVYRFASKDEASTIDDRSTKGRPRIYPFYEMEIGQAAIFDGSTKVSVRSAVQNAKRINGWEFRTKTLADGSIMVKRVS